MPYLNAYVDAQEALSQCSVEELKAGLTRRSRKERLSTRDPADYRIPSSAAREALDDASRALRRQGRTDLAFKLDEIREDYLP